MYMLLPTGSYETRADLLIRLNAPSFSTSGYITVDLYSGRFTQCLRPTVLIRERPRGFCNFPSAGKNRNAGVFRSFFVA